MALWALLAAVGSGLAAEMPAELAIRDAVAARLDVPSSSVEVSGVGRLPNAPELAEWVVTLPRTGSILGDVPVSVRTGTLRYAVRPHIIVWRDLPVAADEVAAGAPVLVSRARVSSDEERGEAIGAGGSWTARVALPAGTPLTNQNVRPSPDIYRGATVRIIADAGLVSVSAPGEILDDGFLGESVAVLNLATRTVQSGVYRGGSVVILEQR